MSLPICRSSEYYFKFAWLKLSLSYFGILEKKQTKNSQENCQTSAREPSAKKTVSILQHQFGSFLGFNALRSVPTPQTFLTPTTFIVPYITRCTVP